MLLTLPNVLTLLRILAVPFFAISVWYGHMLEACLLFMGAGFTDMLDGYIARRFNQRSSLGAILDPAADKLLMTTAFLLLAFSPNLPLGRIPAWVAILSISRDVLISLVAVISAGDFDMRRFHPSLLGKCTTAAELVAISVGLLFNVVPTRHWFHWLVPNIYYLVAMLVLASGLHYFFRSAELGEVK
jgi:cardiolipin synthase